jgi:hypothetical protein
MRPRILAAAALLATTAAAEPAAATDIFRGRPIHEVYREGFLVGFSLGAGDLSPDSCRDCGLGVGADFHIGAMASREVAVMLEAAGVGRGDVTHGMLGVAAQWWPDPVGRFWVKGGVGIGSFDRDNDSIFDPAFDTLDGGNDYVYPTVFGSGGVEVVRSGRFTIDIQLRGAATRQRGDWGSSVSVNVGLNWY